MIPLYVSDRLNMLAGFRQEFTPMIMVLSFYAEFFLSPSNKVLRSCRELDAVGTALVAISFPSTTALLDQKISVEKWLARTSTYWPDEKKKQSWLNIPEHLQLAHIWESKELEYWSRVLRNLDYWWEIVPCQLRDISWTAEPTAVKLVMHGRGTFEGITPAVVEEVEREFWILEVQPYLIEIPVKALHAETLATQFWVQQGNGRLRAETKKDEILIELHIPRVDIDASPLKRWPLSAEEAGRIVDEISYLIASGMQESSQKLEKALADEIERLSSPTTGKTDWDVLSDLRQKLGKLRDIEQGLDDWLNDFPYSVEW